MMDFLKAIVRFFYPREQILGPMGERIRREAPWAFDLVLPTKEFLIDWIVQKGNEGCWHIKGEPCFCADKASVKLATCEYGVLYAVALIFHGAAVSIDDALAPDFIIFPQMS